MDKPNPLLGILKSMRPHQWVKNAFVLAPVVFSRNMTSPILLGEALLATFAFCLLSGAVYLLNDLADLEADRAHPEKKRRPIASGAVPLMLAKTMVPIALITSLGTLAFLSPYALGVASLYFVMNLAYSLKLKHVPFLDVTIIAAGFLLRILAGSFAIDVPVSHWLVECTFLLALYLALGKRLHELGTAKNAKKQRAVLALYKIEHVRLAMKIIGATTLFAYTAYTLSPGTQELFGFSWPKLATTIPFTVFGLHRFSKLASRTDADGSPTEQMLKDVPFLANIGGWIVVVVTVVYAL